MQGATNTPADVILRIGPVLVDVAEDRTISTIGYSGGSPGPLIRLKEGKSIRNIFELTSVDGKSTSGVMKDVVLIKGFGRINVDFTADQPGLTLFHCHQELHMSYGFMKLFDVV